MGRASLADEARRKFGRSVAAWSLAVSRSLLCYRLRALVPRIGAPAQASRLRTRGRAVRAPSALGAHAARVRVRGPLARALRAEMAKLQGAASRPPRGREPIRHIYV